jgi:cold shock CspA family protein
MRTCCLSLRMRDGIGKSAPALHRPQPHRRGCCLRHVRRIIVFIEFHCPAISQAPDIDFRRFECLASGVIAPCGRPNHHNPVTFSDEFGRRECEAMPELWSTPDVGKHDEARPLGFLGADAAPTGPAVDAIVKWFNPEKGFGFVELPDGAGDAFFHIAVLERSGHDTVLPGTKGPHFYMCTRTSTSRIIWSSATAKLLMLICLCS